MRKKAIVLLSGGIDSATCLYLAKKRGFRPYCLVFDYGQRHKKELRSAINIARRLGVGYSVCRIPLPWKGSSLLDKSRKIPKSTGGIPSTYVPGRNIIFLSFALSAAEAIGAKAIFIGAHAQDYSGYPDCRPQFYRAFQKAATAGTKAGVENRGVEIKTPLINKTKSQIIRLGAKLKVPFELTWSCYMGGQTPCGKCDSCFFRARGFRQAGIEDPGLL